jgi:sec-independent protein translocase protein TatA
VTGKNRNASFDELTLKGVVMNPLFGMFGLGAPEILILLVLGVLLFGRKLPEVGRYLGKGIVEFKRGVKGLEDDVEGSAVAPPPAAIEQQPRPPQRVATTAPKFVDESSNAVTTPPKA